MPHADFVHLHLHTQYSLLDGACQLDRLIAKAKEYRMPALAVTDHGNLFGAVDFYALAAKEGIKPIIGCELYMAPGSRFERTPQDGQYEGANHITLLCRDLAGYKNLIKLVTAGYLEGFYYKPRIDRELFAQHGDGLVVLSFLFSPGERHSYSGEGINLLQMVIEEVTGKGLEALAQEKVFQPLDMTRSSYVWQREFETNYAYPHDQYGRQRGWKIQQTQAGAGGSMVKTAGDYARFIARILNTEGQRRATVDEMLTPQIAINYKHMFGPEAWVMTDEYQDIHLSWGLGWGLFETSYGRALFHTGHGFGWHNYTSSSASIAAI